MACRQQAGAHRDVVVASSAPGLPPRVAAWSLVVRSSLAVPWSVVPSGSAAQVLQRALRAAAWHRVARPSDPRQARASVSSVLWARQAPRLAQAELAMRSVREELSSAQACAQAALRLERSVSAYVQGARPSAAAYAQAAPPWAAVVVPDARAARRPAEAASGAEGPQRAVEAEVSAGAAGLQPAVEMAGLGAAEAPRLEAAVAGWGAAAELRPAAAAVGRDAVVELPQAEAPSDVPALRPAARPSAAALVFRRDRPPAALARRRLAQSAHAMQNWRAALPSARSWQAARDEGLSWWRSPERFLAKE